MGQATFRTAGDGQVIQEHFTVERGKGAVDSEHDDLYEAMHAIADKPPGWCVVDWRGIVLAYRSGTPGIYKRNKAALKKLGVKDLADLYPSVRADAFRRMVRRKAAESGIEVVDRSGDGCSCDHDAGGDLAPSEAMLDRG